MTAVGTGPWSPRAISEKMVGAKVWHVPCDPLASEGAPGTPTPMATIVRKLRLLDGGSDDTVASTQPTQGPRLRVAIASRDGKALNAHFGFAERLMVYDVTRQTHRLVQVVTSVSKDAKSGKAGEEDGIAPKVAALAGCHVLFVLAIGPPAAARVIGANIHPIKIADAEPIGAVISRVQAMMNGEPPPWLRKVLTENRQHL